MIVECEVCGDDVDLDHLPSPELSPPAALDEEWSGWVCDECLEYDDEGW